MWSVVKWIQIVYYCLNLPHQTFLKGVHSKSLIMYEGGVLLLYTKWEGSCYHTGSLRSPITQGVGPAIVQEVGGVLLLYRKWEESLYCTWRGCSITLWVNVVWTGSGGWSPAIMYREEQGSVSSQALAAISCLMPYWDCQSSYNQHSQPELCVILCMHTVFD